MRRIGRRGGFQLGAAIGLASGLVSLGAALAGSFWLFCVGNAVFGVGQGFAVFYRFAAADAADLDYRPKAVSLVLSGGVAAAILGPELAKRSDDLIAGAPFGGTFIAVAVLYVAVIALQRALAIPRPSDSERLVAGRPLAEIARQPSFAVAVLAGMVCYGIMVLLMTAAPLAMVGHLHSFDDAAFVIQAHALGMFAPSFVTGHLIRRFGLMNVLLAGAALMAACIAAGLSGTGMTEFLVSMFFLGVGWNFLFIGATTLLTETYRPEERAKVQAVNDFLIFGLVAISSFSSGALLNLFGWEMVNYAAILPLAAVVAATLWLKGRRRAQPA
jgi:MFS family permease